MTALVAQIRDKFDGSTRFKEILRNTTRDLDPSSHRPSVRANFGDCEDRSPVSQCVKENLVQVKTVLHVSNCNLYRL